MLLAKIIVEYTGFCLYRRSPSIWPPVTVLIVACAAQQPHSEPVRCRGQDTHARLYGQQVRSQLLLHTCLTDAMQDDTAEPDRNFRSSCMIILDST